MMRKRLKVVSVVIAGAFCVQSAWAAGKPKKVYGGGTDEVQFSNEEFKKLDRLEAHALERADKVYREQKYRLAAAEYETFLREFPRSTALPYVLLRKARCLHKDDKRHEAIQQYNEVLDYFPNAVEYAATALFCQGLAHWENGDEENAMKHWAKMARDTQYRKHRLAAGAINKLADHLASQGQADSAATYFWQIAVDFRSQNHREAGYARSKVLSHYVRANPNEPKLRKFYAEAHVLHYNRKFTEKQLGESFEYWSNLRGMVESQGRFKPDQGELRNRYYAYWVKQFEGKFLNEDDYQIGVARLHLAGDGDTAAWIRRLDEQFARGKTGDFGRIVKWISLLAGSKSKAMEYYRKLVFEKMDNGQIISLMKALYDGMGDVQMGRNAFGKIDLGELSDGEKVSLAKYFWDKDFDLTKMLCASMSDKDRGKAHLLQYYHDRRDLEGGLPLADHLIGVPEHAANALWKKAELLQWNRKWALAIDAFRQSTNSPSNYFRIAECYEKMGQLSKAVAQLREVEAFFKDYSAQAAIRIARAYKRTDSKEKCVAAYRQVLVKYPDTTESSEAHNQLESMGVTRIKGGVRDGKEDPTE